MQNIQQDSPVEIHLREILDKVDRYAADNVRAGRGGPFGAALYLYEKQSGALERIGEIAANAVLETGMGSAHAEDRALQPANVEGLKHRLSSYAPGEAMVVLVSSAESCPACHAKEEIVARSLMAEKLIAKGDFLVVYGATYADTAEIAGFNDAPYLEDLLAYRNGAGMICVEEQKPDELLEGVYALFQDSESPVAVVSLPDGSLIAGHDQRKRDVMASAELSAIRAACRLQKGKGVDAPWNLGGATLYSSTPRPGPLAYAECQWANVTKWVCVAHERAQAWKTREAPDGLSNAALLEALTEPYNDPASVLRVIHFTPFANVAQKTWRAMLEETGEAERYLYNGIEL